VSAADLARRTGMRTVAMIAEFEADLTRMRTREGMKIAKANGPGEQRNSGWR
jgi:DNA invertase Pin-like site-specific DNA recombinase